MLFTNTWSKFTLVTIGAHCCWPQGGRSDKLIDVSHGQMDSFPYDEGSIFFLHFSRWKLIWSNDAAIRQLNHNASLHFHPTTWLGPVFQSHESTLWERPSQDTCSDLWRDEGKSIMLCGSPHCSIRSLIGSGQRDPRSVFVAGRWFIQGLHPGKWQFKAKMSREWSSGNTQKIPPTKSWKMSVPW